MSKFGQVIDFETRARVAGDAGRGTPSKVEHHGEIQPTTLSAHAVDVVKAYALANPHVMQAYVRKDGQRFYLYGGTEWTAATGAEVEKVGQLVDILQERVDPTYDRCVVRGAFYPRPSPWVEPGDEFDLVFERS